MTATAPANTSLRRIARITLGLVMAMLTPFTMLPLTPWLTVWFIDGVPPFTLLFAIGAILAPLPGLAMLALPEPIRRKILVALGLAVLALLMAKLWGPLPHLLGFMQSLALGTILSTLALWILVPSRAR